MTEKKKRPLRDRLLLVASNSSVVLEAVDELDRLAVIYHHQGKMLPEHAHRATVAERRVRELDESFDRSNMAEDNMPQICLDLKVEQQQHLKTIAELRKLNTNQYDQITKLEMSNEKQKRVIDDWCDQVDPNIAAREVAILHGEIDTLRKDQDAFNVRMEYARSAFLTIINDVKNINVGGIGNPAGVAECAVAFLSADMEVVEAEIARRDNERDTLRKCLDVAVKKLAYLGFVEDIERIAKIKEDGASNDQPTTPISGED